jgi:DNA-directed RNA polymerase specialized sigma24 family protein
MRRTLVDQGRARNAKKRVSTVIHWGEPAASSESATTSTISSDLQTLERYGDRLKQVVEMKLLQGCKISEIAVALGVSSRTVGRDWKKACEALGSRR